MCWFSPIVLSNTKTEVYSTWTLCTIREPMHLLWVNCTLLQLSKVYTAYIRLQLSDSLFRFIKPEESDTQVLCNTLWYKFILSSFTQFVGMYLSYTFYIDAGMHWCTTWTITLVYFSFLGCFIRPPIASLKHIYFLLCSCSRLTADRQSHAEKYHNKEQPTAKCLTTFSSLKVSPWQRSSLPLTHSFSFCLSSILCPFLPEETRENKKQGRNKSKPTSKIAANCPRHRTVESAAEEQTWTVPKPRCAWLIPPKTSSPNDLMEFPQFFSSLSRQGREREREGVRG